MRKIIIAAAFLLSSVFACYVNADVFNYPVAGDQQRQKTLSNIHHAVSQVGELKGRYRQEKLIQILTKPLITVGHFELSKERLDWHITEPLQISYLYQEQRLTRLIDGKAETISPAAEPLLYGFFNVFFSLLQMQADGLDQWFEVFVEQNDEQWQIGLIPKRKEIAETLARIVVQGKQGTVEQVFLAEPTGDTTTLNFTLDQHRL